jgi:hypothetical protein
MRPEIRVSTVPGEGQGWRHNFVLHPGRLKETLASSKRRSIFKACGFAWDMSAPLKMIFSRTMVLILCALLLPGALPASAGTPTTNALWAYQLLHDSSITDDCPICGRPTIQVPMRGTFNLRLLNQNPFSSLYALEDIQFCASDRYHVTGSGTFEIGGEFALVQRMALQVRIDNGVTNKLCYFTNATAAVDRLWPMIDICLDQTNGTFTQVYSLRLAAAPLREIWFSTVSFFSTTSGPAPARFILGGDLISTSGRIVKENADLYGSVGATPPGPDLGLDAVDILPGGEIAFSLDAGFPMSNVGPIQHGDLLSTRGRILRRNQDLLAPFGIQPAAPDVGLDAVHILDTGEILFSIETNIFSERLGLTLHRGDLLSSSGLVVRTYQQMLARFHPSNTAKDYGLDALYLWPSGEMWFSTEEGFDDSSLGPIFPDDLLSDQGVIVFRNLELLSVFAPAQNQSDYGLDALYVVTDSTPPAPASRLAIQPEPSTGSVGLTWQGQGRVFQVERAGVVTGAFQALSPIIPDLFFDDLGALTNRARAYYRLRQW